MELKPNTFYEIHGGMTPYNIYFVDSSLVVRNILTDQIPNCPQSCFTEILNLGITLAELKTQAETYRALADAHITVATRMKWKLDGLEGKTSPIDPFAPRPADAPPLRVANNRVITTGPKDPKEID